MRPSLAGAVVLLALASPGCADKGGGTGDDALAVEDGYVWPAPDCYSHQVLHGKRCVRAPQVIWIVSVLRDGPFEVRVPLPRWRLCVAEAAWSQVTDGAPVVPASSGTGSFLLLNGTDHLHLSVRPPFEQDCGPRGLEWSAPATPGFVPFEVPAGNEPLGIWTNLASSDGRGCTLAVEAYGNLTGGPQSLPAQRIHEECS